MTAGIIVARGAEGFTFFYDHWPALITASLANSLAQAFYVYALSFKEGRLLAKGGNSGNALFYVSAPRASCLCRADLQ